MLIRRFIILFLLLSHIAEACKVPVFRYALERWKAEPYTLKVHHRGAFPDGTKEPLIMLADGNHKKPLDRNLLLDIYDISEMAPYQLAQIARPKSSPFPSFALYPASSKERPAPILVQPLTKISLESVIDSPTRKEITKRIISGESAVWVLVKSGDANKDALARKAIEAGIEKATKTLKISEDVVKKGELDQAQKKGEVDMDDVLYSAIPLKIAFSIIELEVNDPKEKAFLAMLTKGINPSRYEGKCLAAPIFGRGRCLGVTVDQAISAESIFKACEQMCGECSCTVKNQSPGYDIVLTADWDSHVDSNPVIIDKVIPELTGAGDFIAAKPTTQALSKDVALKTIAKEEKSPERRTLWMILVVILAVLAAGTIFILRKQKNA